MPSKSLWYDLVHHLSHRGIQLDERPLRAVISAIIHAVIEADVRRAVEADRYERKTERRAYRNGYRPTWWPTPFGDVVLRIPKLRKGSYYPDFLSVSGAIDEMSYVALAAWLNALDFTGVARLLTYLDLCLSQWEIAEIHAQVSDTVSTAKGMQSPYVLTDISLEMISLQRMDGYVVLAIGETADGVHILLDGEWLRYVDEDFWDSFLRRLGQRGVDVGSVKETILYPRAIRLKEVSVDGRLRLPSSGVSRRLLGPISILSFSADSHRAA